MAVFVAGVASFVAFVAGTLPTMAVAIIFSIMGVIFIACHVLVESKMEDDPPHACRGFSLALLAACLIGGEMAGQHMPPCHDHPQPHPCAPSALIAEPALHFDQLEIAGSDVDAAKPLPANVQGALASLSYPSHD